MKYLSAAILVYVFCFKIAIGADPVPPGKLFDHKCVQLVDNADAGNRSSPFGK